MSKSKNTFIVMVGMPGSGKSTYVAELEKDGYVVHASDRVRAEMGDESDQEHNGKVFDILYKRVKDDLAAGKNVVLDATNLRRKNRRHLLRMLERIPCYKKCVIAATPFEECICNNAGRERQVPEHIIWKMLCNFQMPTTAEGFDEVEVLYSKPEYEGYYGCPFSYIKDLVNYDQGNSNHMLSLGQHMDQSLKHYLHNNGEFDSAAFATYIHDIGKPFTRTEVNKKGEDDGNSHYYNHHNVSAYLSLFLNTTDWPWIDKQYVALLVELHMRPHLEWKQSEEALKKETAMFGQKVIDDVYKIHMCDLFATRNIVLEPVQLVEMPDIFKKLTIHNK